MLLSTGLAAVKLVATRHKVVRMPVYFMLMVSCFVYYTEVLLCLELVEMIVALACVLGLVFILALSVTCCQFEYQAGSV